LNLFGDLGIEYLIGGSVASSLYGEFRHTNDIDFVADVREEHVQALVRELEPDCYLDSETILEAIRAMSSFSVLHLETMVKADIFLRRPGAWADEQWARRRITMIGPPDEPVSIYIPSAEDMILQKLVWFRMGGGISDRQWRDVGGMLEVQRPTLDLLYLRRWADDLGIADLLEKAIAEADAT
jgi:hypothetical protein